MSYIDLTYAQVGLAASLIVVNSAISFALRLGMERTLALASLRTILQLLLIGFVLEWVFRVDRWYIVVGLLALMTLIAGVNRGGLSDAYAQGHACLSYCYGMGCGNHSSLLIAGDGAWIVQRAGRSY